MGTFDETGKEKRRVVFAVFLSTPVTAHSMAVTLENFFQPLLERAVAKNKRSDLIEQTVVRMHRS